MLHAAASRRWEPLYPALEPRIRAAQPERFRWPRANGSGWIGPVHSPLREDHAPSFSLRPDSETEPGGWVDHGTGETGSMAELAQALGLNPRQSHPATEARPVPELTLEEFARRRRLDLETLRSTWRVTETTRRGRPALQFPTRLGIDRVKFLDGEKPKAEWVRAGGGAHLYGLKLALDHGGRELLYLVNGEPSVWACAQARVPAVALAAGETATPTPELAAELVKAGVRRLAVVYDRDRAGRRGARAAVEALTAGGLEAVALELPPNLGPGGDVDDLHRRVGDEGLAAALAALPALVDADPVEVVKPEPEIPWPDPLGLEAYHGPAGDFARLVEPHTEADPAALLLGYLLAAGSALGPFPRYRVGGDDHTARLFVVLVGETSRGRKGSSWGWVRELVAEADPTWRERVAGGLSSGEGMVWAVRDPIHRWETPRKKKGEPAPDPELVLVDPGVEDKRLAVVEGEFASTLRVAERDGSTLSAMIRSAWDVGPTGVLQSLVKNSPGKATGAHISILGHVTAPELRRYLTSTEAGNGYANRFLWVAVRRSKLLPDGGSLHPDDLAELARDLGDRISRARKLGDVRRSPEAAAMWREAYPLLTREEPGLLGAVTARAEAQVLRLSLVYALLDESPEIRPEHLAAALEVWRYAEDSARYIFGDAVGDPVADEILRALRGAPNGLTRNDLRDLFSRNVASGRMGAALDLLARSGKATMTAERTGGRPAERWRAKPARGYAINAEDAERVAP